MPILKVNNINSYSGNTLNLGASTDAVQFTSGATLTLPSSSVSLSNLTATGTPSSTTFLRGDNTWNSPLAGSGPAFSAYLSTNQSLSNSTFTKVAFNTVSNPGYNINSNYDTTNYRFLPTVAGYYFFNSCIFASVSANRISLAFYKNGSNFIQPITLGTNNNGGGTICATGLIYCNGSTDYVESWAYQEQGSTTTIISNQNITFFQGFLARTA
jgi:hypothetical protein